jgi:nucleotide-binding universal stress UspA family protein
MRASGSARVVVGVDGSPASAAALRWAAAEARLRGMRLHVVQVRDQQAVVAPGHVAPSADGNAAADRAVAECALHELICRTLGPDGSLDVQRELADGLPVRVLLDRAAGAALLALGSARSGAPDAGQAGKPRPPLGPVARDCLRAAPCPVVIVTSQRVPPEAALPSEAARRLSTR